MTPHPFFKNPAAVWGSFLISAFINLALFFYFFSKPETDDYAGWYIFGAVCHGLFVALIYDARPNQPLSFIRKTGIHSLFSFIVSWSVAIGLLLVLPAKPGLDSFSTLFLVIIVGLVLMVVSTIFFWIVLREKTSALALKILLCSATVPNVLLSAIAIQKIVSNLFVLQHDTMALSKDDFGFVQTVPFFTLVWVVACWASYWLFLQVQNPPAKSHAR